jgi:tetratricopeptide (TPR) repeat protein
MTPSLVIGSTVSMAYMAAMLAAGPVQSAASYGDAVRAYRAGRIEEAVVEAEAHAAARQFDRELDDWIDDARDKRRRQDLEAALLLHTEVVLAAWGAMLNDNRPRSAVPIAAQMTGIRRLHDAVASFDQRAPFLRTWYLLWEAFGQGHATHRFPQYIDYLPTALRTFPDDARVLLSAASYHEVQWWTALDNPQRHPSGIAGAAAPHLRIARDYLRKSVAADARLPEPRLRLGRVLMLLGDSQGALAELRPLRGASNDRPLNYLVSLFLGEVYERLGNIDAAAAEYQTAAELVTVAQSARLALAQLAHRRGERKEAAGMVARALAESTSESDPWWWYFRGQWGLFERLLDAARTSVQVPRSSGPSQE